MVCFSPANLISSTYTDKNIFLGKRTNIPNMELFANQISTELSQIAVPIIVLLKDDRADSVQEEQLDLPNWTMILAISALVDVSKCLDTPIWEVSITSVHLPF